MTTNTDRTAPPLAPGVEFTKVSNSVYVEWSDRIYVWHWCTTVGQGAVDSRWVQMGTSRHEVQYSTAGVSFSPSLYFNECCGLHGWIKHDAWVPA